MRFTMSAVKGVVKALYGTYGFIRGEDGVDRFLYPGDMQITPGVTFEDLRVGMSVRFNSIDDHPKGPRATEVLVTSGRKEQRDGNQA
jgi:cold shock CspA family protein